MLNRDTDRSGDPASPPVEEVERRGQEVEIERQTLQERLSEWLDLPMAILALLWTGLLVVELSLTVPPGMSARIYQVDFAIWLIFATVFLVEFALAPRKLSYLRSNSLAALSVVLPFARVVRILRLVRLLRSISLVRIVLVANRATGAAAELFTRHRLQYVVSLITISTLLGAAGLYFFERDEPGTRFGSFGEALWWAATMVTTINTGNEPVTLEGRVIGLLLRVVGLATFGYVTASIASFLIDQRVGERERGQSAAERQLAQEVRRLRAAVERLEAGGPALTRQGRVRRGGDPRDPSEE